MLINIAIKHVHNIVSKYVLGKRYKMLNKPVQIESNGQKENTVNCRIIPNNNMSQVWLQRQL
mgnify:CR=1 FL=1